MDAWQKLLIDEREELDFFLAQQFKERNEMTEQQENRQPYLGQRVHVEGHGFGTIVALEDGSARVEIDGQASQWYSMDSVELLPTYPAV